MEDRYYTLNLTLYRVGDTYHVELAHTDPTSQAQVAPLRGRAALDPAALLALQGQPEAYGQALAAQLFAAAEVKQRFVQVETAAYASSSFLRLCVCVDVSAQELQSLRWELLRHPETGAVLSVSERLLLSRFMASRDFRPVKLRARTELVALIAVAAPAPETLQKVGLSPVDFMGEVGRIKAALGGVKVRVLGGPGAPVTLGRLLDALRAGVDVLYLVSHGRFGRSSGTPALMLQDEAGEVQIVKGDELAARIGELQKGPRLVVLASCQSSGDGEPDEADGRTTVQATLAGRLADAGVPAVLAMQGFITLATVEKLMPVFFRELLVDGQIDRALAVARDQVREHHDFWMPALYTRLTAGRLWYTSGFRGGKGQDVWRKLVTPVQLGRVVPILGPRLLDVVYGTETTRRLAVSKQFPYPVWDWDDLPRVTEYMKVRDRRFQVLEDYKRQLVVDLIDEHRGWLPPAGIPPAEPNPKLSALLKQVSEHRRRTEPGDAWKILAAIPAPVYLTTTFDPLLQWALEAQGRTPQTIVTRWQYDQAPLSATEQMSQTSLGQGQGTAESPIVYHAFGRFGKNEHNLVLTEDDHFDYLIATERYGLMPPAVEAALVDNSLLFLGFRLTDWHFRVLFRLLMNLEGRSRLKDHCHVAVQLDPDLQIMSDVEGARRYLAEYFGKAVASIDLFWGSAEEFLRALDAERRAAGLTTARMIRQESEDDWT